MYFLKLLNYSFECDQILKQLSNPPPPAPPPPISHITQSHIIFILWDWNALFSAWLGPRPGRTAAGTPNESIWCLWVTTDVKCNWNNNLEDRRLLFHERENDVSVWEASGKNVRPNLGKKTRAASNRRRLSACRYHFVNGGLCVLRLALKVENVLIIMRAQKTLEKPTARHLKGGP